MPRPRKAGSILGIVANLPEEVFDESGQEPSNGHSETVSTVEPRDRQREGADVVANPSDGADDLIVLERPYAVDVTLEGVSDILFHRWNVESVEKKANAAKGSKQKKTDDVESYVWRVEGGPDDGCIGIPGEYLRRSCAEAARYLQDPRSPRKSARDLYNAGLVSLIPVSAIIANGRTTPTNNWSFLDRRRVVVQRSGVTRERPAFHAGWAASFVMQVLLPNYIRPTDLLSVMTEAGKLSGLGDFRPTFGRFVVTSFKVLRNDPLPAPIITIQYE